MEEPPVQRMLGGEAELASLLDRMIAEGEAVVRRAAAAPGDAQRRYRAAELEIHLAMRPEFGPANASLFGARERKLEELARALGLLGPAVPSRLPLDEFVRSVRGAVEALRASGLSVEEGPARTGSLLWQPDDPGWRLAVEDPGRTIEEHHPYEGTSAGPKTPATPRKVHPRLSLFFFPPGRMTTSIGLMRREQPGTVEGALPSAILFALQAPQSLDQDPDGRLGAKVRQSLFPAAEPREVPSAAAALGASQARLRSGVLEVRAARPPPPELPRLELPAAEVLLWSVQGGAEVELMLVPLR